MKMEITDSAICVYYVRKIKFYEDLYKSCYSSRETLLPLDVTSTVPVELRLREMHSVCRALTNH